mmetsp:Transcript_114431/g.363695  ORF Transcript_114431/g.363695 Transcript_114431/m.363695 type:complete len:295 (+) Transcript_114431:39-923(+)
MARSRGSSSGSSAAQQTYRSISARPMATRMPTRTAVGTELSRPRPTDSAIGISLEELRAKLQPAGTSHFPCGSLGVSDSEDVSDSEVAAGQEADVSNFGSDDAGSQEADASDAAVCVADDSLEDRDVSVLGLVGCWVDSIGNLVLVRSASAPSGELAATLIKASHPDIHLRMRRAEDNGIWQCGDAVLDLSSSRASMRLAWVFPDGHLMVWMWKAFTMEALALRGLVPQEDLMMHAAKHTSSGCLTPSTESPSPRSDGDRELSPMEPFLVAPPKSAQGTSAHTQWVAVCVPILG